MFNHKPFCSVFVQRATVSASTAAGSPTSFGGKLMNNQPKLRILA
jgi:hypothetical protein